MPNFKNHRYQMMTWPKLTATMADCFHCGGEYEAHRRDQLYCSEKCKSTAQNKRKVAARKAKKT